ncbi:hypothetical protein [Pedobacter sp. N23S346]|uniref:hypothetical protein n=1 Tax=Pedobacter sp. N23S346 TaxID=3402750 RepID=UPI003AD42655
MMRYLIIFGVFSSILFNIHKVRAQVKGDTVYYLLDTAAIPAKDRIFTFEREGPFKLYVLQCRCYPFFKDISFFYSTERHKNKKISIEEFSKIKTVPITQLIDIAVKCLPPADWTKYKFVFIEPDGENMRLIDMALAAPYNPRKVNSIEKIKRF